MIWVFLRIVTLIRAILRTVARLFRRLHTLVLCLLVSSLFSGLHALNVKAEEPYVPDSAFQSDILTMPVYSYGAYALFRDNGFDDVVSKIGNTEYEIVAKWVNFKGTFSFSRLSEMTCKVKEGNVCKVYSINDSGGTIDLSAQSITFQMVPKSNTLGGDFSGKYLRYQPPWISGSWNAKGRTWLTDGKEYMLTFYADSPKQIIEERIRAYVKGANAGIFKDWTIKNFGSVDQITLYFKGDGAYHYIKLPTQKMRVVPVYWGRVEDASDSMLNDMGYPTRQLKAQEGTKKATEELKKSTDDLKDKLGDTSGSGKVGGKVGGLFKDDGKKESLLYPVKWTITTLKGMSSAPTTGKLNLPAPFTNGGTWTIDFTILEKNISALWLFIRGFMIFTVAFSITRIVTNMLGGGTNDS